MTENRWIDTETDAVLAAQLARETGLPPPLAALLVARGHSDATAADRFLNPRLSEIGDPFGLPQMDRAVERIWRAIDAGLPMVVYGDYDVDGVTATSVLTQVLSALGGQVRHFLPDRETEGYGFTVPALDRCLAAGATDLIITVDCGTTSVEAVEAAKARGVDVIVTDHHDVAEQAADPFAMVNPKLGDVEAFRILAGVGVAFKLSHALVKSARDSGRPAGALDLRQFLDLVATGTIADMVPLEGENRIFSRYGLAKLSREPSVGLQALRTVAGSKGRADGYEVGFRIGPRLNAAGRLGSAEAAIQLLTTTDAAEAARIADDLDAANRERQSIEKGILDAAVAELDARFDPERDFGVVVGQEGWHKGVVGIVASRISRRYHRPAVVVAFDGEEGRGSCRSIDDFDILAGLTRCADTLTQYGGHKMAAGVSLSQDRFDAFARAFNAVCTDGLKGQDLRRRIHIDAWLQPGDADRRFYDSLDRLRPFGTGNPRPTFGMRGVRVMGKPRIVGQGHLKMLLTAGGTQWDSIGFGLGDREVPEAPLDFVFNLELNEWQGRESLQLNLADFRPSDL